MAIKNTNLGGTDWGNEGLTYTDLNDTFDAAVSKIQSLSAFWLNSDLYDVYDDFDSYSAGVFSTNTNWTITLSTQDVAALTSSVYITNTQYAGGATNELRLQLHGQDSSSSVVYAVAQTNLLSANTHVWGRVQLEMSNGQTSNEALYQVSLDGTTFYSIGSTQNNAGTDNNSPGYFIVNTDFLVVAKGSGNYDLYVGGKKVVSDTAVATMQVAFRVQINSHLATTDSYYNLYVDDIRQAKSATQ